MIAPVIVGKALDCNKKYYDKFEIVEKTDKVDANYGLDIFSITKKDIEALLNGKCLYADEMGGEYACIVVLEGEITE